MKHFVYILQCADDSLYTGYTTDIARRVKEHNGELGDGATRSAGARYTHARRPVTLVYHKAFPSRSAALQQEWTIKQLTRKEKLALVAGE